MEGIYAQKAKQEINIEWKVYAQKVKQDLNIEWKVYDIEGKTGTKY